MRSISRTALLKDLAEKISLNIDDLQNNKLFEFMFCQDIDDDNVDWWYERELWLVKLI